MCFYHLLHHRTQLSVYRRLNDIPVPGLYGPSADELLQSRRQIRLINQRHWCPTSDAVILIRGNAHERRMKSNSKDTPCFLQACRDDPRPFNGKRKGSSLQACRTSLSIKAASQEDPADPHAPPGLYEETSFYPK